MGKMPFVEGLRRVGATGSECLADSFIYIEFGVGNLPNRLNVSNHITCPYQNPNNFSSIWLAGKLIIAF